MKRIFTLYFATINTG